jgi:DNA (cytosine-5)-methyltransferase 1
MKHYDLFSGIGGFSLALDRVYGKENTKHIFVENDKFCQAVLKKHWPEAEYWGDIREFIADTRIQKQRGLSSLKRKKVSEVGECCILTGGFPCQPFSQAGRRKGTEDNRYLWPEMFRAIQLVSPDWVVAENVFGLVNWNGGLVFEQICSDLETEGYEVQPFIIPAVAVNAPHRRDRVWIVANSKSGRNAGGEPERSGSKQSQEEARNGNSNASRNIGNTRSTPDNTTQSELSKKSQPRGSNKNAGDPQNPISKRSGGRVENNRQILERQSSEAENERPSWEENWVEIAAEFCRVDDGLPFELDGIKYSASRQRVERLKMLGNAIVPKVAEQISKAIKAQEGNNN